MVLKVSALNPDLAQQVDSDKQPSELIQFLCPDSSKQMRISMVKSPEILVFPTSQTNGIARVSKSKRVPIRKDGHFSYGGWPQTRVSPTQTKKLNALLQADEMRCDGFYYTLNNKPCQEFELDGKFYVLLPDHGTWFETKPVEWVYDQKLGCTYTHKALWRSDELERLGFFGWQVMQRNKQLCQLQERLSKKQVNPDLRDIEADVLRTVRFLRDKEKEQGIVAGKGRKMYDLLRCQFYKNQQKGEK